MAIPPGGAGAADVAGVVVERITPGSASERAGLRPGDRLVRWERDGAGGEIASPFDVEELQLEDVPSGDVRLIGVRGDDLVTASLRPEGWGLLTRPDLPPDAVQVYRRGRQRLEAGKRDGVSLLHGLVQRPLGAAPDARLWLLGVIGRTHLSAGLWGAAGSTLEQAVREARDAGRPLAEAQLRGLLGHALHQDGRLHEARSVLAEALALRRRLGSSDGAIAPVLDQLATLAAEAGRGLREGATWAKEAVAIRERLMPRSLPLARSLTVLGLLTPQPGRKVERLERAMALIEELAPEGPDAAAIREHLARHTPDPRRRAEHARRALAIRGGAAGTRRIDALHALAAAQIDLGDLDGAEQSLLRAGADIVGAEDRRADHDETRGLLSLARGDLAAAESMIGRALRREERRATVGVRSARLLVRLGDIARLQGDLDAAEAFLSRSLAFGEHENDDALAAAALAGLGDVAHERGDGARAEERHRKAGAILAAIDPDHPALARAWRGLAQVLLVAGRLDETEPIGRRVLAADERERPGTLALVETRHLLGELALRRGDPAAAERVGREALTLVQALAPGSRWEARTEELLAAAATRQGRREAAVAHLRRALDALEAQAARLGGSLEALAQFSARHEAPYRELEALLLALGRPEEAFHTLERRRSRALLALRRVRHLRIERFSPEEVRTEVRLADAAYDRVLRRLGDAPAADRAARDALAGELATARRRRQQARARRRWNGVVVTSEARAPLDLPGVRELLPAGTLLLAYSFGPQASRVYTVGPGAADFGVFPLTADDAELRDLVRGFREQVDARRGSQLQAAVLEHARRLGEVLLGPVAPVLRRSDALLVVPDGPLHLVPFAALVAPGSARYLVEEKPLHVVASATLYADLAALPPRPPGPIRVVGFGDPSYAASAGELPPPVTTAVRAGLRLDPLPFSRRELTGLQGLGGEPQIWLGADASEERAKALGADARIIHFACHGYVDREYPLESALALATPREAGEDAENGLLQAWEILEEVRIDAELVTLSACETAVGKAVPGEGVLGLTWAFQYAGARSVLASLWEVNDASTAELMGRFYAHLRTGHGKAEALRRAQLHLLQEPATSAPYFWAAFQLAGSGR